MNVKLLLPDEEMCVETSNRYLMNYKSTKRKFEFTWSEWSSEFGVVVDGEKLVTKVTRQGAFTLLASRTGESGEETAGQGAWASKTSGRHQGVQGINGAGGLDGRASSSGEHAEIMGQASVNSIGQRVFLRYKAQCR